MLSREDRILGEILVSRGLVDRTTVESCARAVRTAGTGSSLLELIAKIGVANESALAAAAAEARDLDRVLAPSLPKDAKLGEFRVVREIGRGGMGIVYEAVQEPLARRVALKVLPAALSIDERRALRFLREARAAARLYHPGIVPVHASGSADGMLFFAMELIEGESVADALARGVFPPERAAKIATEVARALAYAHDAGLVHRDIKPENILLGPDGRARVADFGLVQETLAGSLSLSQHVLGTPAYLAPEQALGGEVDARADVYATGAVLYTMLCGQPPYSGEIPSAVIGRLLHEDPSPLEQRRQDVPASLAAICRRAMARDPRERYASAAALADTLEAFLGESVTDSPRTPVASRRALEAWRPVVLVSAALAVLAAWLAWSSLGGTRGPRGESAEPPPSIAGAIPMKGEDCCSRPGEEGCETLDLDLGTGVDDSARSPAPIAPVQKDDDWWIVVDPNEDPVPRQALVVKPHPHWPEIPGGRWISANMFGRNGVYVYRTCFCVGRGVREPILGLGFLADDFITAVRLNGTALTLPPSPRSCIFAEDLCQILMTDATRLTEGRNCLEVEVKNAGGSPTGLVVSANVRGTY
jgi:hypothetical protein